MKEGRHIALRASNVLVPGGSRYELKMPVYLIIRDRGSTLSLKGRLILALLTVRRPCRGSSVGRGHDDQGWWGGAVDVELPAGGLVSKRPFEPLVSNGK